MTAELPTTWRALAVDDSYLDRRLLEEALRRAGAAVTVLDSGRALLQHAREACADVFLLDIRMPGMDGIEVLRRLRADPRTATVPAIAVTGDATADDVQRYLRAGFAACVGKPFEVAELLRVVSDVVTRAGERS